MTNNTHYKERDGLDYDARYERFTSVKAKI